MPGPKPPPMVNCPVCAQSAPYTPENRYRPFCSERCKLIDLGQWASEGYRVPEQEESNPKTPEEDES
jgi:uncharacterized protein